MYKIKRFSYATSAIIGSLGGGALGTGIAAFKKEEGESKKDRKRRILKSATIGAGVGAGVGIGGKYISNRYKNFIGPAKEAAGKSKNNLTYKDFAPGDIIAADRGGGIKHYGVVIDDKGTIVEYGAKKLDPRLTSVRKVNIDEFRGDSILSKEAPSGKFTREEIIKRAEDAVGKSNGSYNLRNNNCEHFARDIANGERVSTQVDEKINPITNKMIDRMKRVFIPKSFSASVKGAAVDLLNREKEFLTKKLLKGDLFKVRQNLTKELGGLSHFDKYQTSYLAGSGGLIGSGIGASRSKKKSEKEAEEAGLKKGSFEYKNYVKNRTREGMLKGAGIGAGAGFGISKGIDATRGKILADKIKAKYGHDIKKQVGRRGYVGFGKSMRGIHSEEKANKIINNWKEIGDYGKNMLGAL